MMVSSAKLIRKEPLPIQKADLRRFRRLEKAVKQGHQTKSRTAERQIKTE
ncbi:hypothetical protein [Pseudobacillus wudalianchiensis]|nr:hypothetical protein [Bacillus wudalianchiensis]